MERLNPKELLTETAGIALGGLKFVISRLQGGAWADLGDRYGEAVGGLNVRPASIQYFNTSEVPETKAA